MRTSFFDLVGKEDGGLDFSFAATGGAYLRHIHFHRRTYTLAGDLHQAELAELQHIMFRTVTIHQLTHIVVELLLVAFVVHVDKIDDDNTSDVPQTKLVNQLVRCEHVKLEGVLFLVLEQFLAAGVDINGEQCFGFLDDEVAPMFKADRSAESRFHLTGDVEMVKDRLFAFVEFDDFLAFRGDELQIMTDLLIDILVIDLNRGEIGAEYIPDDAECPSHFFAHEAHGLFLLERLDRLSPAVHQEP